MLTHNNDKNNPHLIFVKGTVLGDKEQGVVIRDKEYDLLVKFDTEEQVLFSMGFIILFTKNINGNNSCLTFFPHSYQNGNLL